MAEDLSGQPSGLLDRRTRQGRLVQVTVVLGSGVALLDGTVVNIAVRTIGTDLDASLAQLQWVVNGYLLSLASLILIGGSLGDRVGRVRMYVVGVLGFALASGACALAQNAEQLIAFRVVQGVAAALLTPGSLAIIQSTFRPEDRPAVIGTWAGATGIGAALGPVVGGLLLEHGGWRWIFAINIPLCLAVVWLSRYVPESRDDETAGRFDFGGGVVGVVMLGGATYALTYRGTAAVVAAVIAIVSAVWFVLLERRPGAMMPITMFASRVFSAANLMTLLVYGALGAVLFFLVLQLQVTSDYSPLAAGMATLPITIVMLLLSSRLSVAAARIGPRLPMTVGPITCAAGVLLLATVGESAGYWLRVFPGMLVFALGLTGLVSPLTTAVLAAVEDRHAGVASGVNNAVARAGSLLAVAALPALVGLSGDDYRSAAVLSPAYRHGLWVCAGLLVLGGLVSWVGLRSSGATGVPAGPEARP